MIVQGNLESILKRDRLVVGAALFGITVLAWANDSRGQGHGHHRRLLLRRNEDVRPRYDPMVRGGPRPYS